MTLNLKTKKRIINLLIISLMILAAFIGTCSIWLNDGWPVNHENATFAARIHYLIQSWERGDIFPIWEPAENYGMGSLMPLLYPKLFTYSGAIIFLLTGEMKTALLLTIILFGTLGAAGIFCCCREIKMPRSWSVLLGSCFIFFNYVQVDLIIRGAMAEYAALCLIPFLCWWSMRLLLKKQFSWWILPLETLLFFAHTAIMIYSGGMVLTAFAIALIHFPEQRKQYLLRALISATAFTAVALPWVLLINDMQKYITFVAIYILLPGFSPQLNIVPPARYLFDFKSSLTPATDVFQQLDTGIVAGLLLCGATLLFFHSSTVIH